MKPSNALSDVRRLAGDEQSCEFFNVVLIELRLHNLDSDDLREIVQHELGENNCFKTAETKKYHPQTMSDYYSIWIHECRCNMFLKLLIVSFEGGSQRLIITSFKKDERYD
jgi:hypothetical protein